jgi:hypothetical protein
MNGERSLAVRKSAGRHPGQVWLVTALALAFVTSAWVALSIEFVPALFVPLVACIVPMISTNVGFRRAATTIAAMVLAGFCTIAILSVGVFFVPCLLAMLVASWRAWILGRV